MTESESYTTNSPTGGDIACAPGSADNAPGGLTRLFRKGARDCGAHEWYRHDEQTDACYHCEPGARPHQPLNLPIDAELRAGLRDSAAQGSDAAAAALGQLEANDRELGRVGPHTGALR